MNTLLLTLLLLIPGAPAEGGTLNGRLVSANNAPVAEVRVALSTTASTAEFIAITQTDREGRYRFENVPPGRYYIVIGRVDSPTYSANAIAVTARSIVEAPELRLAAPPAGLTAKGRVTLEGIPAGQAPKLEVRFNEVSRRLPLGSPDRLQVAANVASDGTFEVHGLRPGQYNVMFYPGALGSDPKTIAVDKDIDGLQFTVPFGGWIVGLPGIVRVDGVAPIPFATLALSSTDPSARASQRWTIQSEEFSVSVIRSGEYRIQVENLPPNYFVKAATAGDANLLTSPVRLSPVNPLKMELTLGVTTNTPGVRVSGRITNHEGNTQPTTIQIRNGNSGLRLQTTVIPDATFEFPMVPPGTYLVEFIPKIDVAPTERSFTIGIDNPTRVEIPLQVRRKITATMTGSLSDIGRRVVPFIQIGGMDVRATFVGKNSAGIDTWEFLNIPPGTYKVFLDEDAPVRFIEKSEVTVVVSDKDVAVELSSRP